jgi:hypothetical protein
MSIVSFADYTPPARFDSIPWTEVRIEENDNAVLADTVNWTQIDALDLATDTTPAGLDPDPAAPEARSFTTSLASSTPELWYRVIFADGSANVSLPSLAIQNIEVVDPYATTDEFFRIIKKTNPSTEQVAAAQRDLATATLEINAEIDFSSSHDPLGPDELALVNGVCLDRAADLWRHRESAPGILGVVDEGVPTTPGRYSFARYISRLSPLKDQWGIA